MKAIKWVRDLIHRIRWWRFVWKPEVRLIKSVQPKEMPGVQPLFEPVRLADMIINASPVFTTRGTEPDLKVTPLREVMSIAEALTTPHKSHVTRILFGYHIEEIGEGAPLSMDTLRNDRPLFLGHDPFEWLPTHFKNKFRIYLVSFMEPNSIWQTKVHENYINGFEPIHSDEPGRGVVVRYELLSFKSFFESGFHMFSVGKNDKNELAETMLLNPRDYVFNIQDITSKTLDAYEQIQSMLSDGEMK